MWRSSFGVCILVGLYSASCLAELQLDNFAGVAVAISREVHDWFSNVTRISQNYSSYSGGSLQQTDGMSAIINISKTLSQDFTELELALQGTLSLARELYSPFFNTECCSRVCIRGEEYTISMCDQLCNLNSNISSFGVYRTQVGMGFNGTGYVDMGSDMELELEVQENNTAIHIPLDIYEQDPVVTCFANWTRDLTPHFIEQAQRLRTQHGNISQYFGSSTGIFRLHPAVMEWSLLNQCYRCATPPADTYDVRDRPWYLNTIPGSKFVVILLDMSGSMTGYRSVLARLAVRQLLNSLNQHDYFLVLAVSDGNRTGPLGCFTSRTRASPENILVMGDVVISSNNTQGKADFDKALNLSLEALTGSTDCHKSIVIFTDGDTETLVWREVEQFSSGLDSDQLEIRVFTYLVGRGGDGGSLKEIACQNRGRMSRIEEYSAIIGKVRMFFSDLRRQTPVELSNNTVFWNRYRGLVNGLSLTGSIPLIIDFNGTRDFVGVVGIDSDLNNIEAKIKQHNLGPLGYGFLLDNNGQLILHPEIDEEYILQDLSNDYLLSLDVSNFEHPASNRSEFEPVRRAMIDRETGNASLEVWLPVVREESYVLMNVTYFYAPVEHTSFSVAIVLPAEGEFYQYPSPNASVIETLMHTDILKGSFQLQDKPYCFGPCESNPVLEPEQFLKAVVSGTVENCNPVFCDPLVIDLYRYSQLSRKLVHRRNDEDTSTIDGIFFQFPSGLTSCVPADELEELEGTPLPWCLDLPYIKLLQLHNQSLLFHRLPQGGSPPQLAATMVLRDAAGGVPSSVVGAVLASSEDGILQKVLQDETAVYDMEDIEFYLLNGNATIMASMANSSSLAGRHFAEVHWEVLQDLVRQGVYREAEVVGYELRPCKVQLATCSSSAESWHRGLMFSVLKWLLWTVDGGLWVTVKLAVLSILSSIQIYTGIFLGAEGAMMDENSSCPVGLCLSKVVTYQLNGIEGDTINNTITLDINGTNETIIFYEAASVPETDLILVAVWGPGSMQPVDNEYPVLCVCDQGGEGGGVYRTDPVNDICYTYDNATYQTPASCSGSSVITSTALPLPILLAVGLLSLLLQWRL